jgi:DNA-binding CsgD family transcriptional regulator
VIRTELDLNAYVGQLEEHLRLAVFGGRPADPEAAVLLVRGALAADDASRAAELAAAAERLMSAKPGEPDVMAAAAHVRGLLGQDPAAVEWAARTYASPLGRAWATEDAGMAWERLGDWTAAEARLREAHACYQQMGADDSADRVRARLRTAGVQVQHRRRPGKPAFGWESLTDTERRVVDLVAQGLSNRQAASQMFLSVHTVAFHLRRVFWKLDVSSRVQLAALAAEQARLRHRQPAAPPGAGHGRNIAARGIPASPRPGPRRTDRGSGRCTTSPAATPAGRWRPESAAARMQGTARAG